MSPNFSSIKAVVNPIKIRLKSSPIGLLLLVCQTAVRYKGFQSDYEYEQGAKWSPTAKRVPTAAALDQGQ